MRDGVVAIQVMVGTDTALVCSRCASGEDQAVRKAIANDLVRDASITRPPVTGEILREHPRPRGHAMFVDSSSSEANSRIPRGDYGH